MPVKVEIQDLAGRPFRIGDWFVEPSLNRLSRGETTIQLELKVMDVLVCLAERAGGVLTRQEIVDRVWATEFISDNTLTHAITELRNALGDDARNPSFIETIHRRGYRLIAPVEPVVSDEPGESKVARFPVPERAAPAAEDRSPYPGLAAFTEADAEFFFGREDEVAKMWRKLTSRRLLAVIGPSGVGKSSFLRAGVMPAKPDGWGALVCQPGEAPFAALARALVPEFTGDDDAISRLVHLSEPEETVVMVSRWRDRHDQALFIVDQFEELFTLNSGEVQARFAALLRLLVDQADIHLLLSMRDDFLYRCQSLEPLQPVLDGLFALEQPGAESLRLSLVEPARRLGYAFEEDDLPGEMVAEVEGERGALPLLAFAVARLWDERNLDDRLLTRRAFGDIGGVGGALARHAEATLKAVGNERLPIVRELFRNLVTAQGTRAVRSVDDLVSVFPDQQRVDADNVLGRLIDARLLTSFEEEMVEGDGRHRVEVVHESLLASWPRLVGWQTQDADAARIRDELRQAAKTWGDHERSRDFLWTGTAYREYRLWRSRYPGGLTELEEEFATAMTSHAKWRRRRRRIATAAALVVISVVSTVVGVSRHQTLVEVDRAEAGKLMALGRLALSPDPKECCPSTALAYAFAAIDRQDSTETRLFALEALWRGPTGFAYETPTNNLKPISADGRWLLQDTWSGGLVAWPRAESDAVKLPLDESRFQGWRFIHCTQDPDVVEIGVEEPKLVEFWSIEEGRLLRAFDEASRCRFTVPSGIGSLICIEDQGGSRVRELPLRGGEERFLGSLGPDAIEGATAAGRSLVTFSGNALHRWDLDRLDLGPRIVGEHDHRISMVSRNKSASALVSADESGAIKIWAMGPDVADLLGSFQGPQQSIDISIDEELRTLAVAGSFEATTWLWDLRGPPGTEPLVLHREPSLAVTQVTLDPLGQWLATAELSGRYRLMLRPLLRVHPFVLTRDLETVWDMVPHPDGDAVIVASQDGSVTVWPLDPAKGQAQRVLFRAPRAYVSNLDVDPQGRWVLAGARGGPWMIPLDGGEARSLPGFDSWAWAVTFSPDGRFAAAGGGHADHTERVIRIWDTQTFEEVQVLEPPAGTGQIIRVTYTPDGKRLISSGWSGVLVWDLEDGSYDYLGDGVLTAVSNDGESLYVAWPDDVGNGGAGVYDLETGELTELPSYGRAGVIALTPDEKIIVTGGVDGTIRVGPVSGEEPHLLMGHTDWTMAVVLHDDRWIVTGSNDGSLRVWPMPDLSRPPLHMLPREELLAKLKSLTNFRAVPDDAAPNGYRIEHEPISGWPTMPEW